MGYQIPEVEEGFMEYEIDLEKVMDHYKSEISLVKAGRANPKILDKIFVDYYNTPTPLNQLASISVPEARMILIAPWDQSTVKSIAKAIMMSDIGITPNEDGKVIRLIFPHLTEERRKEIAKTTKKLAEDAKIAGRNARRDAMELFKKLKKESKVTEDMLESLEKDVQKIMDAFTSKIDAVFNAKEKEIMQV